MSDWHLHRRGFIKGAGRGLLACGCAATPFAAIAHELESCPVGTAESQAAMTPESALQARRDGNEPRGGRVLLLTNVELRFPIPYFSRWNFGGALFVDGGNVWESVEEIEPDHFRLYSDEDETTVKDYRYGIGFGVRYNTPVGPIRLDIGFPLKRTTDIDYDYWLHISLGQIF